MNTPARTNGLETHEVFNQPPPLTNYNLFLTDATLVSAIKREGAVWVVPQISELGRLLGTEELQRWGSRMTAQGIGVTRWCFIPVGTS